VVSSVAIKGTQTASLCFGFTVFKRKCHRSQWPQHLSHYLFSLHSFPLTTPLPPTLLPLCKLRRSSPSGDPRTPPTTPLRIPATRWAARAATETSSRAATAWPQSASARRCSSAARSAAPASSCAAWTTTGGASPAPPSSSRPRTSAPPTTGSPPTAVATVTLPTNTSFSQSKPLKRSPFGKPATCPYSTAGTSNFLQIITLCINYAC